MEFYWNGKELEPLRIQDDLEQYIQNRGTSIASAVSSIERSYISIEVFRLLHRNIAMKVSCIFLLVSRDQNQSPFRSVVKMKTVQLPVNALATWLSDKADQVNLHSSTVLY